MKKAFRSVTALFLAAMLLLGSFPFAVWAEGYELPVIPFQQDEGSIADQEYEKLFYAALVVADYHYNHFDVLWPRNLLEWARGEEPDRIREADGRAYLLMTEEELIFLLTAFFAPPVGFAEEMAADAKTGESLGEIPAYDEQTGKILIAEPVFDGDREDFEYYGFMDNGDKTVSFYFAGVTDRTEEGPVFKTNGVEVVLQMEEDGVHLVRHNPVDVLPDREKLTRTDRPYHPRTFDYEWGREAAKFIEAYREETLKEEIASITMAAIREGAPELIADGRATVPEQDFREGFEESIFRDGCPRDFFENEFLPDVKAGKIPGISYEDGAFVIEDHEPNLGGDLNYDFVGWIKAEDHNGGDYYFAEVTGWSDPETPILGKAGICVTVAVEDGRMVVRDYRKIEELPEEFDLEPQDPGFEPIPFDFFWGRDVALFLEEYYDEYLTYNISDILFRLVQEEAPERVIDDAYALLTREELEQAFEACFAAPRDFFEEVFLQDVRAEKIGGLPYDAETGNFKVQECGAGDEPGYLYAGWIEAEDHNGGDYYFAEVTGWDEKGEAILGSGGILISLHAEDGHMVMDDYRKIEELPEEFDSVPQDPEPEPEWPTEGDFAYEDRGETVAVVRYIGTSNQVVIPDALGGKPVTEIVRGAFRDMTDPFTLTIPETVGRIESGAFQGCTGLTGITLTGEKPAFELRNGCLVDQWDVLVVGTTAAPANLPAVAHIAGDAFSGGRPGLVNVTIPDAHDIGDHAFAGASNLETIAIPASVVQIDEGAFENCTALQTVYYTGTREDWEKIEIRANNDALLNAQLILVGVELADKDEFFLSAENGVLPPKANLVGNNHFELSDGWKGRLSGVETEHVEHFEMTVWAWDEEAQQNVSVAPQGKVRLTVPVPENMRDGDLAVFYLPMDEEEGVPVLVTEPILRAEDGAVTFETDRLGHFALAVKTTVWGDANGDGRVDTADIIRLKNYLAGVCEVIGAGADANGDDRVDTTDITRLKNYLANYNFETGERTVDLGK